MKLNLSNAYPLCITISFELNDDLCESIDTTEVKSVEIIVLLLVTYCSNIIDILEILMFARKIGA